jgi:hypothetical protein
MLHHLVFHKCWTLQLEKERLFYVIIFQVSDIQKLVLFYAKCHMSRCTTDVNNQDKLDRGKIS